MPKFFRLLMVMAVFICLVSSAMAAKSPRGMAAPSLNIPVVSQATIAPLVMPKAPDQVTLFPRSALVTVEDKLAPTTLPTGEKGLLIALPASAVVSSFTISLEGNSVASLNWFSNEDGTELLRGSAARRAVAKALQDARTEHAQTLAAIEAATARIQYWSRPVTTQFTQAAEVEKIDAVMQKNLVSLHASLPGLRKKADELARQVGDLERRLGSLGHETLTIHRLVLALASPANAPVSIKYSYMMSNCGWIPAYRFEAQPAKKQILFSQDAEIWQNSGLNWDKATLSVATVAPSPRLAPMPLREWRIFARTDDGMKRQMDRKQSMVMAEMAAPAMTVALQQPQLEEKGTFAQWNIGQRSLPTGEKTRVSLVRDTEWKTDFYYTLRPSQGQKGFLTGKPELPAPLELPRGQAIYLVDNTVINTAPLAFSGDTLELYFGSDALVSAEMKLVTRVGGEKGLISKERKELWQWEITAANNHSFPVEVRIEEPVPSAGDEAIKTVATSDPKPEIDDVMHVYTWKRELPARTKWIINHKVEVTAPTSMPLVPGR